MWEGVAKMEKKKTPIMLFFILNHNINILYIVI